MNFFTPNPTEKLTPEQLDFLRIFSVSCRRTILQMLAQSQSGHPGGSLSTLDFLAVLYAFRITQTDEPVVISNGHISPAVYSVLAECGAIPKQKVIDTFRQASSIYEGHVTRHVPGVHFGTGPLGVGISAACGFALAEKKNNSDKKIFATIGDGEAQEGQVGEAALFAAKENLDNLVVFCDYNQVQLTDSLEETLPINVGEIFRAHGWEVLEINGHDHQALWEAINTKSDRPTMIVGKTIMGYGVNFMQKDGEDFKATWHGKAPSVEQVDEALSKLQITNDELQALENFREKINWNPAKNIFQDDLTPDSTLNTGNPIEYSAEKTTDCRSAYGNALTDLAEKNSRILAGSADLSGSVKTDGVAKNFPHQYIEFGICEQNMVSVSGALSLAKNNSAENFIPFCSTFGAFMSSRAKDQARVNDINQANVKMVSTHCGLSVGEDGPTHQAIDDMGSFLGFFHTHVLEPADPNHCDRLVRFAASHYGNFYIRMGRHKLPTLQKENGDLLFSADYLYEYGKTETLRSGDVITIIAAGPMATLAFQARENTGVSAEIIVPSSPKKFDENLKNSIIKTKNILVIEDHNALSGYASQVALFIAENNLTVDNFKSLAVSKYQLSGKPMELYEKARIGLTEIEKVLKEKYE